MQERRICVTALNFLTILKPKSYRKSGDTIFHLENILPTFISIWLCYFKTMYRCRQNASEVCTDLILHFGGNIGFFLWQSLSLGMLRSDIMLETHPCSTFAPFCCWKQVEINSIASGFGWMGPASGLIHRSVDFSGGTGTPKPGFWVTVDKWVEWVFANFLPYLMIFQSGVL